MDTEIPIQKERQESTEEETKESRTPPADSETSSAGPSGSQTYNGSEGVASGGTAVSSGIPSTTGVATESQSQTVRATASGPGEAESSSAAQSRAGGIAGAELEKEVEQAAEESDEEEEEGMPLNIPTEFQSHKAPSRKGKERMVEPTKTSTAKGKGKAAAEEDMGTIIEKTRSKQDSESGELGPPPRPEAGLTEIPKLPEFRKPKEALSPATESLSAQSKVRAIADVLREEEQVGTSELTAHIESTQDSAQQLTQQQVDITVRELSDNNDDIETGSVEHFEDVERLETRTQASPPVERLVERPVERQQHPESESGTQAPSHAHTPLPSESLQLPELELPTQDLPPIAESPEPPESPESPEQEFQTRTSPVEGTQPPAAKHYAEASIPLENPTPSKSESSVRPPSWVENPPPSEPESPQVPPLGESSQLHEPTEIPPTKSAPVGHLDPRKATQTPSPIESLPPLESPSQQPPTEQPPTEQPPSQQPPTEQLPTEQPPSQQPPTEQPPTKQLPTQQPPIQQPPTEQLPSQQPPPTEQPPTEQPPTEQPQSQQPPSQQPPSQQPPGPHEGPPSRQARQHEGCCKK
ncbi:hypothetical protein B7463_g4785, partial [Scytalidium lignicola]